MFRYMFAAVGSATVLPAVESIGVGWFSTISAGFLVVSTLGTWATVIWGRQWRDKIDNKRRAKRQRKMDLKEEVNDGGIKDENVLESAKGADMV